MAEYTKRQNLADVRKANKTLSNIRGGKAVSDDEISHMKQYIDGDNLNKDDSGRLKALDSHKASMAKDSNHFFTDVNPYNGSERWVTLPNGSHVLIKAGTENYKRIFKETSNRGEHTAVVSRRTERKETEDKPGAKVGDRRDIRFKLDNLNHPPDPDRAAQDKKHNLITVPEYDSNGEMLKNEQGKPVFKRITLQDGKLKNLTDSRGRLKKFV